MREFTATGQHRVWKYKLPGTMTEVTFSPGRLLRIDFDPRGELCAWVLVHDTDGEPVTRRVLVRGTGDPLPEGTWAYLNTFMRGEFVFHAFVGWVR